MDHDFYVPGSWPAHHRRAGFVHVPSSTPAAARVPSRPTADDELADGAVCRPRCGSRKDLKSVHMQLVSPSSRRENTRRSEFLSRGENIVSGQTRCGVCLLPHVFS